jgi:lipopolysaccharide transport system permease protein
MSTIESIAQGDPGDVERVIRPSRGWIAVDWKELYQSRELFDTLITRDIKIRYKQSVLGVAWAVIQPLASMFIFTVIFGNFPGVRPSDVPYPLYIFAGLVPWTFFTNAVTSASVSLLAQQGLLTKIYFPRLYLPASNIGAFFVDMAVGFAMFGLLLIYFQYVPSWQIVFVPLIVLLNFVAALGIGLILSAVTIMYRDLRFVVPFLLQLFMFASPIFYRPGILPWSVQALVAINPMAGIITAYRWCFFGTAIEPLSLAISVVSSLLALGFGLFFFRRSERFFADII